MTRPSVSIAISTGLLAIAGCIGIGLALASIVGAVS